MVYAEAIKYEIKSNTYNNINMLNTRDIVDKICAEV